MSVGKVVLYGGWSVGQKFLLSVGARVTVLSKGVKIYERSLAGLPLKQKEMYLDEWLARDAVALKEAFTAACLGVAETAVEDIFGVKKQVSK